MAWLLKAKRNLNRRESLIKSSRKVFHFKEDAFMEFVSLQRLWAVWRSEVRWGGSLSLKASSSRRTPTRLDIAINNQQTKLLKFKIESLSKVNQEPNPKSPQTWHHSPTPSPIDIKFQVRTESISSCFMKSESWKGGEPSKHWLFIFYAQKGKISRSLSFRHEQLISKLINRMLDLFIYFTEQETVNICCLCITIYWFMHASELHWQFSRWKNAQTIVGVSRLFTFLRSARAEQQQREAIESCSYGNHFRRLH